MSDTMRQRDDKGRFVNGNTVSQFSDKQSKCLRASTNDEIIRCVHSLTKPMTSLTALYDKEQFMQLSPEEKAAFNGRSILQCITDEAVLKRDTKWLEYLINRGLGRIPEAPKERQNTDFEPIDPADHSRLVELVMTARELKQIEDEKRRLAQ